MRIPRTNFPIKTDEYEFETELERVPNRIPPYEAPVAAPAPAQAPLRAAEPPRRVTAQYEPLDVRRSITPAAPARPVSPAIRPQRVNPMNADDPSLPISKRMFSLSENVRFTRTPDSELLKGKLPEIKPAPRPAASTAKPTPIAVPQAPAVPQPPNVAAAPRPASARIQKVPAPTRAADVEQSSLPPASASPLAYVSDFAFFDSMDIPLDTAPKSVAPARPNPKPAFSLDEITARFRIVECTPAGALEAAPKPRLLAPPLDSEPVEERFIETSAPIVAEVIEAEIVMDTIEPMVVIEAEPTPIVTEPTQTPKRRDIVRSAQPLAPRPFALAPAADRAIAATHSGGYEKPPVTLLQEAVTQDAVTISQETLEQNAGLLESVLEDFGVRGEIIHVRPGPVVTLYEFEPAPGVKSSRVINLADDIARSMSALSARVAVVPGRNVIGIELPNATRETVYLREMVASENFDKTKFKLALCLGKTIGGEPVIAELAKMPHLLVAGTTGSGKSVAINTMILSLLYRLTPDECRLIMVDPKMLELSIYDGIPHLLTPVVTDPKKAVMALKWAVREMEDRYRKMSKLGVRNIDGFNARVTGAAEKGETVTCTVQTGFDKGTGEPIYEQEAIDLKPMPFIVIIVDEMADLMMVAGKEIEGAIQRLAQMARAAGIHLIMATQRPSVDVITGTIKANFPTRISFQVTSKIDSRTILGEQGAEQLLGQGDMLHMIGGGRISRVHGPFVSDEEVEKIVAHLKAQGQPDYLDTVTADESEEEEPEAEDSAVFDKSAMAAEDGNELYDQAVKVMLRDKKCSTSYIQRRLGIGYNRAASLVERMEKEGLVGPANHVGKREILHGRRESASMDDVD
ncbi:DNA translocase FtsK [Phyllobacterium sp. SYP-B3895]|uniref:DNA translocase FtsK n=1 Tax=Phyllobacterium sp. SYP-B3895 TaxID=2663240 RepID=UPI001299FF3A|nr:DNA translocase FtsK [Phyllobacterium sp. SYP-B3895]MRG56564.1 DNA translocase FtsK [Phyllobacterium sp. SYP-B3895]